MSTGEAVPGGTGGTADRGAAPARTPEDVAADRAAAAEARRAAEAAPLPDGVRLRPAAPGDWDELATVLTRDYRANGLDEARDGAGLAAEHEPLDRFDLARDVLVAEADGRIAGFVLGTRVPRPPALTLESWGAVDPAWQRRGIGTRLAREARARLAAEAADDPRPGPRELRGWAVEAEAGTRALLAREGYVAVRHGFEMRRSLGGPLPRHPVPPGLEVRPAAQADLRRILLADDEAFRDHWGHREIEEGDLRARLDAPDTDPSLWAVAWDGDEVAGVVLGTIYHEDLEQLRIARGWLDHVSVRRPWRGRGLAKALCADAMERLRGRGMTEVWLGVDGANPTGALGLYEGLGFTVARRWAAYGRPLGARAAEGWRGAGD